MSLYKSNSKAIDMPLLAHLSDTKKVIVQKKSYGIYILTTTVLH